MTLRRIQTILTWAWKPLVIGGGIGLGATALILLLTTLLTFQVEFDMYAVALVAYAMLVVGAFVGAAIALTVARG